MTPIKLNDFAQKENRVKILCILQGSILPPLSLTTMHQYPADQLRGFGMGGFAVVSVFHVSGKFPRKLYDLPLYDLRKIKCYKQSPGHLALFRTMIKACMMQEHDQLEDMKICRLSNHHVENTG